MGSPESVYFLIHKHLLQSEVGVFIYRLLELLQELYLIGKRLVLGHFIQIK